MSYTSVRRIRLAAMQRPGPLVALSVTYLAVASGIMIWRGISVSPDYLILLMVPVALVAGRFVRFLKDWVPFIAIFLGWEAMRGIAPKLGIAPHVGDLAAVERTIFFGHYPTQFLQSLPPSEAVRDAASLLATIVYFCHFLFPLAIGFVLWQTNRIQFLRFTTALMGMAFAAFVIYLLVPTAPPWYAQQQGSLCCISKLISQTLPSAVSPFYQNLNPNQVAALPSLHAAFPFLAFLALRDVYPRAAWLALAWCVLVWISVVYLGEHYAIDVIAGVAMAAAAWAVLTRLVAPHVSLLQVTGRLVPVESRAESRVA